jgi:hypothetical protein
MFSYQAREARVPVLPIPQFPSWLRPAVRYEPTRLWRNLPAEKDPIKARKVLEQLITNPLMEGVWNEIYRKRQMPPNIAPALWALSHKQYFNAARLTNESNAAALREEASELRKKGGDKNKRNAEFLEFEAVCIGAIPDEPADPRWSEQDRAAQLFLSRSYEIALSHDPQLVSDLREKARKLRNVGKKLRIVDKKLRQIVGQLQIAPKYYAEKVTDCAEKLIKVALDCESDAQVRQPNIARDTWLVTRRRGDLMRKTFVAKLAYTSHLLFGNELYNTIATVTNVVFSSLNPHSSGDQRRITPIKGKNVREILRVHANRIRPSFGPVVLPLLEVRMKEVKARLEKPRTAGRSRNAR